MPPDPPRAGGGLAVYGRAAAAGGAPAPPGEAGAVHSILRAPPQVKKDVYLLGLVEKEDIRGGAIYQKKAIARHLKHELLACRAELRSIDFESSSSAADLFRASARFAASPPFPRLE